MCLEIPEFKLMKTEYILNNQENASNSLKLVYQNNHN